MPEQRKPIRLNFFIDGNNCVVSIDPDTGEMDISGPEACQELKNYRDVFLEVIEKVRKK